MATTSPAQDHNPTKSITIDDIDQVGDVVTSASATVSGLASSTIVDRLSSTIDDLLKKAKVFDDVVTGIAQVFGADRLPHVVFSVAYSPDDTNLVSGSLDNSIRVWNATTGECVAGPFQGHTDAVRSVAYPSDVLVLRTIISRC